MATKDNVQGVVLALFGASAGGHLTALTGTATANGLTALATDLAASAGFILGKDLSTAAAFRDNMLTGLGITSTNSAYAAAAEWADAALAAPGANRGEVVATAVNYLAGLTDSTSPFYAVATTYQATVAAAVARSEGAGKTVFGVADLQAQQGTSGGAGSVFTLDQASDAQNFAAFENGVTVLVKGDNDSTDGTDFDVTLSAKDDLLSVVEFRNMTVNGGDGTDTLEMSDEGATVNAQRGEAYYTAATANVVQFSNMEIYSLSDAADAFTGGVGNDVVVANGGDDSITGGAGDDKFVFVDVEQLGEVNTQAISGGIGIDTLEIGVTKSSSGYTVDLDAEDGTSYSTNIEKLVVTGVADRDSTVHNSTITVDAAAGFTKFVGATATDKLVVNQIAATDMKAWSFESIREVEINNTTLAGDDVTVKQAQLDQVDRWVTTGTNHADLTLLAETGAASQTFDLTGNYLKGFASLNESTNVKTTVVADSRTIAGFDAMALTSNDTLKIVGDADLSDYVPGTDVTLSFDSAVTLNSDDWASGGNFKKIVGTGLENELTFDTSGGAVDASGLNFAGVVNLKTTSADNGITLSATSVYTAGLQLNNAAPLTLSATGRAATTDYATFADISLVGTSKTIGLVGAVEVSQSLLNSASTFNSAAASVAWVSGDADFSHITSSTNVSVQDTSGDNDIIGMSADATYVFSKKGEDSFTGNSKNETVEADASAGSLTAAFGDGAGTSTLTVKKAQDVTATFGASGDFVVDVQSTATSDVNVTVATLSKAVNSTPTITLDLNGKGAQTVVIGDILSAAAGTGVYAEIGGTGDVDLTVGAGFATINMDTAGSGDITIEVGDGGHIIQTGAAQSGYITVTTGENLDDDLTTGGDGLVNLSLSTGGSTIEVGDGGWTIQGGSGKDEITAGEGDDVITAGIGGDVIDLSAGGVDALTLESSGSALSLVTGAAALSMSTFTGYATISGFALGTTDALSDSITLGSLAGDTLTASFATSGLNGADSAAVDEGNYLYTGTASNLLNVADIIDKIGAINTDAAGNDFMVFVNNTAGTQFGVYHVVTVALNDADADLDADVGATIELMGVVNTTTAITAANFEKYID